MSKKMKLAAVLTAAALLSPAALAGGDGKPCFWKGGDSHETTRTVAETPVLDETDEAMEAVAPATAIPDENAVVKLDENGEPAPLEVLPEAEAAASPAGPAGAGR